MDYAIIYKGSLAAFLIVFWIFISSFLTTNPSLTIYVIGFSFAMISWIFFFISFVFKKDFQARMEYTLDSEIKERKGELIKEINNLAIYLGETEIPSYSESGVEGLEDDFREFDSIKSKYTFQPKIIKSALLIVVSSFILFLFWTNPSFFTLLKSQNPQGSDITLAYVGVGFLTYATWMILSIFFVSLEAKIWEKERKPKRHAPVKTY